MNAAELAAAVAQYQQAGGHITTLEEAPRTPAARLRQRRSAADAATIERLRALAAGGVVAAAKALRRSTRTILRLAEENDIAFPTCTSAARKALAAQRNRLAPQVRRLAGRMSQQQIAAALNTTRAQVRRIAAEHRIDINSRRR